MILALAGGVGGAKLASGLAGILGPDQLSITVNTADDFVFHGLSISPDLDTVTYTLAGLNDKEKGWGVAGESWQFLAALERLGGEAWFKLGDKDLATHVMRSCWLSKGRSLSEVTASICSALGIIHQVFPMSDDPVRTFLDTEIGELDFQTYFVRERCQPKVLGVRYVGADQAKPSEALVKALQNTSLSAIIICPSNPILSVAPILAVSGVTSLLRSNPAPVIAVSPLIEGKAVKGPAAKLFRELGKEPSVVGVAEYYGDLLDGLVIDVKDKDRAAISQKTLIRNTLMQTDQDKKSLARDVLAFASSLT
ncbi:MAG: 2-phospho-L-lactate transferase [Pseudomonadota bacterium]|nr:2-phospho-L-lactate transferase [Pseudomonadota bacterium]